uniref:Uncharacterized protein n=1 Tax=Romanomermis culicivorax TaxID=13658 RepID=A0A915LD99_ROMCU
MESQPTMQGAMLAEKLVILGGSATILAAGIDREEAAALNEWAVLACIFYIKGINLLTYRTNYLVNHMGYGNIVHQSHCGSGHLIKHVSSLPSKVFQFECTCIGDAVDNLLIAVMALQIVISSGV